MPGRSPAEFASACKDEAARARRLAKTVVADVAERLLSYAADMEAKALEAERRQNTSPGPKSRAAD